MALVIVDRMTVGLANELIIFDSSSTDRMSLDENAAVGDHMIALIRMETLSGGVRYDHDGTSDAAKVPGPLELSYILTQPNLADAKATFNSFHRHLGKEMTLRTLASTTATAKMSKCRGTFLNYAASDKPHVMRIEFEWQLKEDFS